MKKSVTIGFLSIFAVLLLVAGCMDVYEDATLEPEKTEKKPVVTPPEEGGDDVTDESVEEMAPVEERVPVEEDPSDVFATETFTDGCTLRSPASSINMWKDRSDVLNADIYEFIRQGPQDCEVLTEADCALGCESICQSKIPSCQSACDGVHDSLCMGGFGPACAKGCSNIPWPAGITPCEDQCDAAFDSACSQKELDHCKDSCTTLYINVCMDKCEEQCS